MKELSLNILDLVQNSITAGAKNIRVVVSESAASDKMEISICDDGCGMDAQLLSRVTDPFTTTRTTRKIGMGIPLMKMGAEMTGGDFQITSETGKGTFLRAGFRLSHIDCPPLGNMADTIKAIVQGSPELNLTYSRITDKGVFEFSTTQVREVLGGISLGQLEVLEWIDGYISEGEASII